MYSDVSCSCEGRKHFSFLTSYALRLERTFSFLKVLDRMGNMHVNKTESSLDRKNEAYVESLFKCALGSNFVCNFFLSPRC